MLADPLIVSLVAPRVAPAPAGECAFTAADVGKRVTVKDRGDGVLMFFGPHQRDGVARCGVALFEANGLNNGTVGVCFPCVSPLCSTLYTFVF